MLDLEKNHVPNSMKEYFLVYGQYLGGGDQYIKSLQDLKQWQKEIQEVLTTSFHALRFYS